MLFGVGPDGDGRLPHLPRGRAAGDPLADGGDRRSCASSRLSRPVIRYLERLASHDLAFRVLGNARLASTGASSRSAPVQLEGYRKGDLLSRMVADVDALQNLHLRAVGPPLVALVAGAVAIGVAAAVLPAAALVLAAGLLAGGIAVPAAAGSLARRTGGRQAAARGELAAELVEVLTSAPELAVYGQRGCQPRPRAGSRRRARAASPSRRPRRRSSATASGSSSSALTVAGVLACAVSAHAAGSLDRTLIALIALLTLASFEAVQPLSAAARELFVTLAAGTTDPRAHGPGAGRRDPADPRRRHHRPFAVALENVRARYSPDEDLVLDGISLRLEPGRRIALVGESGAGKTTVVEPPAPLPRPGGRSRVTLGGRDLREFRPGGRPARDRRRRTGLASLLDVASARTSSSRGPRPPTTSSSGRSAAPVSGLGDGVAGRLGIRSSASKAGSSREASANGSRSPAPCLRMPRSWCWTSRPRISTRPPQSGSSRDILEAADGAPSF